MRAAAWLLALCACTDYAHLARTNAPGIVPELAAPLPHENGDPGRREVATDPGTCEQWFDVMPFIEGGRGRGATGAGESGVEVRYEPHAMGDRGDSSFGAEEPTLLVAAGLAGQWRGARGDTGVATLSVGVRAWGDGAPHEVSLGPVLESGAPGWRGLGAELTYRLLLFFPIRVRYTPEGGTEVLVGFQVSVPIMFAVSR